MTGRPTRAELHDGSRTFIPNQGTPLVTTSTILDAFARKLSDINRRHLLSGGSSDIQTQDPRALLKLVESMCSACRSSTSRVLPMDQAEALGAHVLALALSIARVEDTPRPDLGDAA